MSDSTPTPRPSLSEISHLFLTELRQRQTNGAARPSRKPPAVSTVEPSVVSNVAPPAVNNIDPPATDLSAPPIVENNIVAATERTISLLVAHHLGASASTRVLEYARQMAANTGPVALIELADEGLRITSLDASNPDDESPAPTSAEPVSYKAISHALEEMSWDIQHWLVFLPNPRSQSAPELLSQIDQWTLLVTAADETVVGGYRALKGLLSDSAKPSISVAVAGAEGDAQADLIHRKLDRATRQFLGVSLKNHGRVTSATDAQAHVALCCRCTAGVTQEHWNAVIAWAVSSSAATDAEPVDSTPMDSVEPPAVSAVEPIVTESIPEPIPMKLTQPAPSKAPHSFDQVLDLSASAESAEILSAILQHHTEWIAAPISAPAYKSAKIVIDREGCLTLLAVANCLDELSAISRAYAWLTENRSLLRMALPQLNIDAASMPRLSLFVDQSDVSATTLGSLLQGSHVEIKPYRRLRWAEKSGLLLAA